MKSSCAVLLFVLFWVSGCGGSGTSTGFGGNSSLGGGMNSGFGATNGSPGQGQDPQSGKRFAIFATDSTKAPLEQVWVTVYEVALARGSASTIVFQDEVGRTLDLRAFDGKDAQVVFLGEGALGAGDFDSFRVTISDRAEVFVSGSATPKEIKFASGKGGKLVVQAPLSTRRKLKGGSDDLLIDFASETWGLDREGASPKISEGPELKLEETTGQIDADFVGQVRDIAEQGRTQTLTLLDRGGRSIRVATQEGAVVVSPDGSPATLARDSFVVARGPYDLRSRTIKAHTILSLPDRKAGDTAHGLATMAKDGEFTLKVQQARGFLPDRLTMRVMVDGETKFIGDGGSAITHQQFAQKVQSQKLVAVSLDGALAGDAGILKARLVRVGR